MSYLQGILAREALVAVAAGEGLDGQVDALVTLQVVVAVEALWALIASERSVVLWAGLLRVVTIHSVHVRGVSAVEGHHSRRHASSDKCELAAGVAHVGEDWARHGVAVCPVLSILWLRWLRLQR